MDGKKILIIGLDGFTWKIGKRLIQKGLMPTLGGLIKEGCHGNLRSVMPFETGPAWSSFQTGCYPNNTGIFSFHTFDHQTNQIRLNSFDDIRVPTLWELLSNNGKEIICINMPVTSPPPKINGVIVPGLLCPGLNEQTVHPPEVYRDFIKNQKDYQIVDNTHQQKIADFVDQSCRVEESRCKVALDIMNQKDWDVFCVQMQSTDLFQHRFWWSVDPEANGYRKEHFNQAARFYNTCDSIIERLVKNAAADIVMIVSDHGFTKQRYGFAVNRWLHQKRYLNLHKQEKSQWEQLKDSHAFLKHLAKTYGKLESVFSRKRAVPFSEIQLMHLRQLIDFESSRAFCLGGLAGVLYINQSVAGKDFASFLKDELLSEFGPASKLPIIQAIKTGIEEYGESATDVNLPDLIVEYTEGIGNIINPKAKQVIADYNGHDKQPGTHARDGIFIATGNTIKQRFKYNAEIVDIAPTVLASMGLPIPKHMDGKVLSDILNQPPDIQYTDVPIEKPGVKHYSDQEQAEVEKRLADLGYL